MFQLIVNYLVSTIRVCRVLGSPAQRGTHTKMSTQQSRSFRAHSTWLLGVFKPVHASKAGVQFLSTQLLHLGPLELVMQLNMQWLFVQPVTAPKQTEQGW